MSEQNDDVLDAGNEGELEGPSPEQLREASRLGWVPKERFKGDPERWVPADEFLERGREVLPLVKATNQRLEGQVQQLTSQVQALTAALQAVEKDLDENLQTEVEETLEGIEAEIAQAVEDRDAAKVSKLTRQLVQLTVKAETAAAPKAPTGGQGGQGGAPLTPEFREWQQANSDWYGVDEDRTAMALSFGQAIRATGGPTGAAFYEEVDRRLARYYGEDPPVRDSRVSPGTRRSSGGGQDGGREPRTKGYAELPREAKEACQRLAPRLVGDGKKHKDMTSWQKSYAAQYWQQEAR